MDEVDAIILSTVRNFGCDIDESVTTLLELTPETVVQAVIKCLIAVDPNLWDKGEKLPQSLSLRYKIGTSLTEAVKSLGYSGDVGYQTFLYNATVDVRRILMFLIDKVPRLESSIRAASEESWSPRERFLNAVRSVLKQQSDLTWTPPYFRSSGICFRGLPSRMHKLGMKGCFPVQTFPCLIPSGQASDRLDSDISTLFNSPHIPHISLVKRSRSNVAASLLALNQRELRKERSALKGISRAELQAMPSYVLSALSDHEQKRTFKLPGKTSLRETSGEWKISRFSAVGKLQLQTEESASPISISTEKTNSSIVQERREEELSHLKKQLEISSKDMLQMQSEIELLMTEHEQLESDTSNLSDALVKRQKDLSAKKKSVRLLHDGFGVEKLEQLVEESKERLSDITEQIELHSKDLLQEKSTLKDDKENAENILHMKLEESQALKQEYRALRTQIRDKEELHTRFEQEYSSRKKGTSRLSYTKRIIEIVSNIKKQRAEIDKIVLDLKKIMREMNKLDEQVQRSLYVADDIIFKEVQKGDPQARQVYRYVLDIHELCCSLLQGVERAGDLMRETRELEDSIEVENSKQLSRAKKKLEGDLTALREENEEALAKIKNRSRR